MQRNIKGMLALTCATLAFTQAARATQATYTFKITNYAPFVIYQYDPPSAVGTDLVNGSPMLPWMTPTALSAQPAPGMAGGVATGFVTTHNSYSSATVHIGTVDKTPEMLYFQRMECAFTINGGAVNADGTCTAPTALPAIQYSYGPNKPFCAVNYHLQPLSAPTVYHTPNGGACDWTVEFIFEYLK